MRRLLYVQAVHFHTSVQVLLDPALRGRPVIVAAGDYQRGVVLDASPEAMAEGVERGMSWRHARRRCPEAALVPYDSESFAPLVEQLGNGMARETPWVERLDGAEDEFFAALDEGGLEEGCQAARRIRCRIAEELGLETRLGLGSGKLVARAACLESCDSAAASASLYPVSRAALPPPLGVGVGGGPDLEGIGVRGQGSAPESSSASSAVQKAAPESCTSSSSSTSTKAHRVRGNLSQSSRNPDRDVFVDVDVDVDDSGPNPDHPIHAVPPGRERRFLAPLPVEHLWELKPEALRQLRLLGLRTLGQVAALPARTLAQPLGPSAYWYRGLARGIDRRRVAVWKPSPVEMAACFLEEDEPDLPLLEGCLERLAGRIAGRLLRGVQYGRTISLTLHFSGGRRRFATRHLKEPTHLWQAILRAARALLAGLLPPPVEGEEPAARPRIEALELAVGRLEPQGAIQLSIFGDEDRGPALRSAIARIQNRYGEAVIANANRL